MSSVRRVALALALCLLGLPATAGAAEPAGLTGFAAAGRVALAWQPTPGASEYRVYRGPSSAGETGGAQRAAAATGRLIARTGATAASDAGVANGTTYEYTVRAVVGGFETAGSQVVQVTPRALACPGAANPVVAENCETGHGFPAAPSAPGGSVVEGFATAQSVNRGGAFGLKAESDQSSFDVEIYRTGYYGGAGARLVSSVLNVPGGAQDGCERELDTGLYDCSAWVTNTVITTSASWPSGVYMLRLVQDDGASNHVLFVVRDDARQPDVLYGVPFTTYAAYNVAGGKSLYDSGSSGADTVAGSPRAVKVSFDRPFAQPRSGHRDWYSRTDYATVRWLEQSGYDTAYESSADLELVARPRYPYAYIGGSHDEYWSAGMRGTLEAMRADGVSLLFSGANAVYWKVRFERGGRVLVCYKSTQSGGPDPSGIPTGTWRDPAGANRPENALLGAMYIGDNASQDFPLRVSAQESSDRIWRTAIAPGVARAIGTGLVGWEWDARVANGLEPAGVVAVAGSAVSGLLLMDAGQVYAPGNATSHTVKYPGPYGSLIFATGTNRWNRGLSVNAEGVGQPLREIQQATTNVLLDMSVLPATPAPDIVISDPILRPRPGPQAQPPVAPGPPAPPAQDSKRIEFRWDAKVTRIVRFRWGAKVTRLATRLTRLRALRVPQGATMTLRCKGRGCPEKNVRRRTLAKATPRLSVLAWVRRWRLRPGARVELKVVPRNATGRMLRLTMRRTRLPRARRLCVPVGPARNQRC